MQIGFHLILIDWIVRSFVFYLYEIEKYIFIAAHHSSLLISSHSCSSFYHFQNAIKRLYRDLVDHKMEHSQRHQWHWGINHDNVSIYFLPDLAKELRSYSKHSICVEAPLSTYQKHIFSSSFTFMFGIYSLKWTKWCDAGKRHKGNGTCFEGKYLRSDSYIFTIHSSKETNKRINEWKRENERR